MTGAAREAGVDKTTAYGARGRDAAFAAEWARVKAEAQARLALHEAGGGGGQAGGEGGGGAPPDLADDEVVRASRAGRPCIARAGPGRWSVAMERRFLEALASTANVSASAAEAGVSAAAVYQRRARWPGFAERWQAALEQGYARLEASLVEEAAPTPEGGPAIGRDGALPSFSERLQLLKWHREAVKGESPRRRKGWRPAEPPIEQVHAELLKRIKAMGG